MDGCRVVQTAALHFHCHKRRPAPLLFIWPNYAYRRTPRNPAHVKDNLFSPRLSERRNLFLFFLTIDPGSKWPLKPIEGLRPAMSQERRFTYNHATILPTAMRVSGFATLLHCCRVHCTGQDGLDHGTNKNQEKQKKNGSKKPE